MTNTNLNQDFDVVVIETVGDTSVTTCFKNYSDYAKDKVMVEGEPVDDFLSSRTRPSDVGRFPIKDLAALFGSLNNGK